jgi:hypothetical protein
MGYSSVRQRAQRLVSSPPNGQIAVGVENPDSLCGRSTVSARRVYGLSQSPFGSESVASASAVVRKR